jgi:hypothetical protein
MKVFLADLEDKPLFIDQKVNCDNGIDLEVILDYDKAEYNYADIEGALFFIVWEINIKAKETAEIFMTMGFDLPFVIQAVTVMENDLLIVERIIRTSFQQVEMKFNNTVLNQSPLPIVDFEKVAIEIIGLLADMGNYL